MGAGRQRQPAVASLQRLPETAFLFRRNGDYRLYINLGDYPLRSGAPPSPSRQAWLRPCARLSKVWKALSKSNKAAWDILFDPSAGCNTNSQISFLI
jgi:hypothetical protein